MKKLYHSCLIILILFITVFSMDGIAVTTLGSDGYLTSHPHNWSGKILLFEIENDHVINRPGEIIAENARCPSLDMSGSYITFFRKQGDSYYVSVRSVTGGPIIDVIECNHQPNWLWWTIDGSWYYDHHRGYRIIKVTIDSSSGEYRATQQEIAITEYPVATGFCDLSMDGKWLHARISGTKESGGSQEGGGRELWELSDNSVDSIFLGRGEGLGSGCACAISPFGRYMTWHMGGHQYNPFYDRENVHTIGEVSNHQNKDNLRVDGDPINARWAALNGWAANSDYWFSTEIKPLDPADPTKDLPTLNLVLTNWKESKVINVTSWDYKANKKASRGDLWCSTQEDVHPDLWHFIENRTAWGTYWDKMLAELSGEQLNVKMTDMRLTGNSFALLKKNERILYSLTGCIIRGINNKEDLNKHGIPRGLYIERNKDNRMRKIILK